MQRSSLPVESLRQESYCEEWVWDSSSKSPDVRLSRNLRDAYFHIDPVKGSTGTAGVRGTEGFYDGEHYWELTMLEPPTGTSVMVGVGTDEAGLHRDNYQFVNLIGVDDQSWGLSYKGAVWHNGQKTKYCEPFYRERTVIGVHLDLYEGTLTFYKDGQSLGVAFQGLRKVPGKLYPMISSTSPGSEIGVGVRVCRRPSLQEKCYLTVARSLKRKANVEELPLPRLMKKQIIDLD